mmetsp:Transcript_144819/g.361149  ORF Transcript_144819/g.361149 Transcript_144819/m.361149 type:complete len:747 (+) Transcript_144819:78-2318(+)
MGPTSNNLSLAGSANGLTRKTPELVALASCALVAAGLCAEILHPGCFVVSPGGHLPRIAGPPSIRRPNFVQGSGATSGQIPKSFETSQDLSAACVRLFAGLVCGLVSRALPTLKAYGRGRGGGGGYSGGGYSGGGGYGGGGYDRRGSASYNDEMRDAKREREANQFWTYQRRLLSSGVPPRDDYYWDREEGKLFKTAHVSVGINFNKYDSIPVERTGGSGEEEPIESFQDASDKFDLPDALVANFERCAYSVPTPVQKHSIPAALAGTDVMVSAQTGSGKTAAFLVPIITTVMRAGPQPVVEGAIRPTAVVLAPTRELCQQISMEATRLCFRSPIRVVSIYGGADAMPQLKALAEGCDIAICTPGRLEDFLGRGVISVENVKYLTLDEADRMLDMGFEPQIRSIIEKHGMPTPEGENGRNTMMFSATFPREMQDMALDFLDPSYMWISVGHVGSTASNVEQRFADVSTYTESQKFDALLDKLEEIRNPEGGPAKTIIFANQKSVVDDIAWRLSDSRIRATPIHGGLSQNQRDRALGDLKSSRVNVLVATDVAARGLDLPGIDHVVNYELPPNADDYVHRIGRTGRIGNSGIATSFVGDTEPALKGIVKSMMEAAEEDESATPVPAWLRELAMSSRGNAQKGGRYRSRSAPGRSGSYGGRQDRSYGGRSYGGQSYGGQSQRGRSYGRRSFDDDDDDDYGYGQRGRGGYGRSRSYSPQRSQYGGARGGYGGGGGGGRWDDDDFDDDDY